MTDFEEVPIYKEKQTDTKTILEDRKEYNFSQQIFNDFINQIPKVQDCYQYLNIPNKNSEKSIKELLRLDHLNREERQHVESLIKNISSA